MGLLQHAARVVPPGRVFPWSISNHLRGGSRPSHHIRLNRDFKTDLRLWFLLLQHWNGAMFLQPHRETVTVTSDVSGSWGCGAYSTPRWFQLRWPPAMAAADISVKELIPIFIAVVSWGPSCRGANFQCYSDNQAVVAIINSRQSRHPHLLNLLRCLFGSVTAAGHGSTYSGTRQYFS